MGRLNEFGASLRLTEPEFGVVLLLDGQTLAGEAGSVLRARAGGGGPVDVAGTVERLIRGGLCIGAGEMVHA